MYLIDRSLHITRVTSLQPEFLFGLGMDGASGPPRILISNDDGIRAEGLLAIVRAVCGNGERAVAC